MSRPGRFAATAKRVRAAGAIAAAALALAGCTLGPSPDPGLVVSGANRPANTADVPATTAPPIGPGGPGREAQDLSWSDCPGWFEEPPSGVRAECASMRIRANEDGTGRRIDLMITRLTADGAPADAPPLIVAPGEPGRYTVQQPADVIAAVSPAVLAARPVVMMDPRGTGESDGMDCLLSDMRDELLALPPDPRTADGRDGIDAVARQITFDCDDIVGQPLTRFTTLAMVNDLDTLRASLGLDRMDYLGLGHGATLGALYAEYYPGRVGAMVLDSPTDPRATALEQAHESAVVLERLLDVFAADCAAGDCPLGDDPKAAITGLVAELGTDGEWDTYGYRVTGGTVLDVLRQRLGDRAGWDELADLLAQARDHEVDGLSELADRLAGDTAPMSAELMVRCNDTAVRIPGDTMAQPAAEAAADAPLFGPYLIGRLAVCGGWPAPLAVAGGITAAGAPPILVVAAASDPAAPMTLVRSLTGQMGDTILVTRQSSEHGSYPGPDCVTTAVDGYLLDGTEPADGLLCPP